MVVFPCHVCRTSLSAEDAQAGQQVRCPTCMTVLRVPVPQREPLEALAAAAAGSGASAGGRGTYAPPPPPPSMSGQLGGVPRSGGKRYGFNCGYCSSRLEA